MGRTCNAPLDPAEAEQADNETEANVGKPERQKYDRERPDNGIAPGERNEPHRGRLRWRLRWAAEVIGRG